MNFIHNLILQNFRNYSFRQFEFAKGINFFIGGNGTGKTNLLEAVSMLGIANGIRGAEFKDLNQNFIKPFSLGFETNINHVGVKNVNGSKRFLIENEATKFAVLEKAFKMLAIMPEDEFIFCNSISERRMFFDALINKIYPEHGKTLKEYKELALQRIKLLNGFKNEDSWLLILEKQISQKLVIISINRVLIAERISKIMNSFNSKDLWGDLVLTGHIENKIQKGGFVSRDEEDTIIHELQYSRMLDAITGKTLTKLERTNFDVLFKAKNVLTTKASSGEQKKMLLSVFMATAKIVNASVILIDEVVSKFDEASREVIFYELEKLNSQVFLTGTNEYNLQNCNFIYI
jgi:DNA replication and repair protein RecF